VTALAVAIGLGTEDWLQRHRGQMLLIWIAMAAAEVAVITLPGL
jgi:hypothetical protein